MLLSVHVLSHYRSKNRNKSAAMNNDQDGLPIRRNLMVTTTGMYFQVSSSAVIDGLF